MTDRIPSASEAPPARRRGIRLVVAVSAAFLLLLACLWIARLPLAEMALKQAIEAEGVDQVELDVTELGIGHAQLRNVRLGSDSALTVGSAVAEFDLGGLVAGRLRSLAIEDLELAMTVDAAGPSLGSLDRLLLSGDGPASRDAKAALPADRITIANGAIEGATPYGPLTAAFDAEVMTQPDGAVEGSASVELAGAAGTHLPGRLDFSRAADGVLSGSFDAAGGSFEWGPIAARALSGVASFRGRGGIDSGKISLSIGELIAFDSRFVDPTAAVEIGDGAASLAVQAEDETGKVGITINGKGRLDAASLVFRLDAALRGSSESEIWRRLDLPDARNADATMSLTLSGPRNELAGDLTVIARADSLTEGDASLAQPELRLVAGVALSDRRLTFSERDGTGLYMASGTFGPVELTNGIKLPVLAGPAPLLSIDLSDSSVRDVKLQARLGSAALRGSVRTDSSSRAPFAGSTPEITLAGTSADGRSWSLKAEAAKGRLELSNPAMLIDGIGGHIELPLDRPEGRIATLGIQSLQQKSRPALHLPLHASLTVDAAAGLWSITGNVEDNAKKGLRAAVTGQHDPASGKGTLKLAFAPVSLAPGKLQLADLFPALRGSVEEDSGRLSLTGTLAWGEQELRSTAGLLVRDLSSTVEGIRFHRVNTVLTFDSVQDKPARQLVAIALIDAGVPLTDGLIAFRLRPDLKIAIEEMSWKLTGGRVFANNVTIDPFSDRQRLTLKVEGVQLGDLLQTTELEGLSATGTLAGQVPVSLLKGETAIENGRLATTGPGVLRYKPDQMPAALQGGGEGVDLMLQALANFHYDELGVTLDRARDGETLIGLHLKGKNPDVYGGYPLEFNLNLSGKLDRILRDSLEGYRIPDTIQRRMQEFGR